MKYIFKLLLLLLIAGKSYGLNVDEVIKSTIENNPKVKMALEKINESKELIIFSKGSKLPDISSSFSTTYNNSDTKTKTTSSTPETLTDTYKVIVTQNLYDAGFNDLEIDRSNILYNNELIKFRITIQNLILDAINGYLSVINFEKSLEANKKNYTSVLKAYEETKTRYNLGSATLYDLENAEASFSISETNLYAAEENMKISKKTFNRIVGLDPVNLEEILTINTSIDIDQNIIESVKNNLELLLIYNDIKNKEILLLKEKKTKRPNLDIAGTATYSNGSRIDMGTDSTSGNITLTLTVPLFQKGQDNSNIRKYKSQLLQSEINLEDSIDDLELLIVNTYKDLKINKLNMNSSLIIIKSIETALVSLKEEYSIGTKTITELVDEEEKLLNANVNYLDYKKSYLLNYFKLKSLNGSLINLFSDYLPAVN